MKLHFSIFMLTALLMTSTVTCGLAQTGPTTTASEKATTLRFEDYENRLNAMLKTRRDEEKKFVADVVQLVRDGDIPEKIVETSYKWVANKRPDTNYPFIFFERVLRIQAKLIDAEIPAFDYSIYRIQTAAKR